MNHDSEAIQKQLIELLQDILPEVVSREAEAADPMVGDSSFEPPSMDLSSLLTPPSQPLTPTERHDSDRSTARRTFSSDFGDIPAVQDRFHALLKQRLQSEIERNPPLFPWESEVHNYDAESSYGVLHASHAVEADVSTAAAAVAPTWLRQLEMLNVPVSLPTDIMSRLLERCQTVAQSALKEGAKLVQAVEDLFPEQRQALNYLAGLVVAAPARSGSTTLSPTPSSHLPPSYEAAAPAQQMVLSLLAAREILQALSLTVAAGQPTKERQWQTNLGLFQLRVTCLEQPDAKLQIQAELPVSGHLTLQSGTSSPSLESAHGSHLTVEWPHPQPNQPYTLTIHLAELSQEPLTFTIWVTP